MQGLASRLHGVQQQLLTAVDGAVNAWHATAVSTNTTFAHEEADVAAGLGALVGQGSCTQGLARAWCQGMTSKTRHDKTGRNKRVYGKARHNAKAPKA